MIELWIADLETLFMAKLLAAEDDKLSGRVQDFPDLTDIIKAMGISSLEHILNMCEDEGVSLKTEYPSCFRRLKLFFSYKPPKELDFF